MTGIQTVLVERFLECVNLCPRRLYLRFSHLRKITGADITCQQTDDYHNHQQFKQREAPLYFAVVTTVWRLTYHIPSFPVKRSCMSLVDSLGTPYMKNMEAKYVFLDGVFAVSV